MNEMYSVQPVNGNRNLQLDVLRGVAVIAVLAAHTVLFRKPTWDALPVRASWTGVDLFFVLSGFLISSLLFSEYLRNGAVDFRRFAIRRLLKIWPPLYFLLVITIPIRLAANHFHGMRDAFWHLMHDVFFLQSYKEPTWGQCWSLGVEEHFYIFLPLLLWLMLRRAHPGKQDPFRRLPKVFAAVALLVLVARLVTAHYFYPYAYYRNHFPTHLRIDSLFFGVILSYYSHFRPERFASLIKKYYWQILASASVLIFPAFVLEQSNPWMYTYGFTCLYLAFGAALIAALYTPIKQPGAVTTKFVRALAYIGTFSYSIYLWHIAWLVTLGYFGALHVPYLSMLIYYGGAIALGILASKLVEVPMLRLRDHIFPRPAVLVEVELPNTTEAELSIS